MTKSCSPPAPRDATRDGSEMTDGPKSTAKPEAPGHPERFGAYRIDGVIGVGGMGIVYRAYDEALARPVALKTLLPALTADPDFVARFKREAQSAAALNHPNITQIYSIDQEGPTPFFAMELIQGRSIEAMIKERGALDPVLAAGYVRQAAEGLRHAARRNLIHRDVKPSNLMLTEEGLVKITDFGLAKASQSQTQLTATGEVLGSPGYISPEQAQGLAIDFRSDIYSLGATFYHMVTGRLPFNAPTPVAMIVKHMNEPLRPPRAANPAVPYPISVVIQRMMAKRAGERFQDYDALLAELERALGAAEATSPVRSESPAHPGGPPRSGRRPPPPRRPAAAPAEPAAASRSSSWVGVTLITLLGGLIAAGVILRSRDGGEATAASGPALVEVSAETPVTEPHRDPAASSGPTDLGRNGTGRSTLDGLRARRAARPHRSVIPPELKIVNSDHEMLEGGRMRVYGEVRNAGGGAAANARVRIKVLDDQGRELSRGETRLFPPIIAPSSTASFEIVVDNAERFASLSAEVFWSR